MRSLWRSSLVLLLALVAAGCARGPDEADLARDVQARLDALFGRPVLVLRDLRRQGSAPYTAADDGTRQVIVYFNGTLEFAEPYDPSDWQGLSPQLIATALGATDQGLVGLGAGPVATGAQLRAYGSLIYRRDGDGWLAALPAAPSPAVASTPAVPTGRSRADELIQRLAKVVDTSPGLNSAQQQQIVTDELDRALQNIQLRLDSGATRVVVATGPAGGEYARFVSSVTARLDRKQAIEVAYTEGSVANAFLVDRGKARFALVQSDVAAAAVTGAGLFGTVGPLRHLRAVASLFPEPVHVVVRRDGGIETVNGLVGRRVSLGVPGSGSRHTALAVLRAHGLADGSYEDVTSVDPGDALAQLATGTLDAVITVASAPWDQLVQAGGTEALRVLPLDATAIERVDSEVHGLVPLQIPARTYPGQPEPVPTVAATALLVANSSTPDAAVAAVLKTLFGAGSSAGRGVTAARLSRERALVGVTIPLHDGAALYFEQPPRAGAAEASTKSIPSR
jgi:TRAP transporter TAXI family solute receptor